MNLLKSQLAFHWLKTYRDKIAYLSKGYSDLKMVRKKMNHFLAQFFMAFQVRCLFLASVVTFFQRQLKAFVLRFLKRTIDTKWITPLERPWKVGQKMIYFLVCNFVRGLWLLERCEGWSDNTNGICSLESVCGKCLRLNILTAPKCAITTRFWWVLKSRRRCSVCAFYYCLPKVLWAVGTVKGLTGVNLLP